MLSTTGHAHRWAVILAGGDGVRLRPLTRVVSGDERPKQFCRLIGGESLLASTRRRISVLVPPERTMLVFTHQHKEHFEEELSAHPSAWIIVQPCNRGTAPAILWSLFRLAELDWEAVVAFFPSDHHFAREEQFYRGVNRAFDAAQEDPETIVVLGAPPVAAEAGYGWIEPQGAAGTVGSLQRVCRFWEKPHRKQAEELLRRGCLWNTFIMVGSIRAFLETTAKATPQLFESFRQCAAAEGSNAIAYAYPGLKSVDFSKQVLSCSTGHLAVMPLGDAGWSDMGEPRRVKAVMAEGLSNSQGPSPVNRTKRVPELRRS